MPEPVAVQDLEGFARYVHETTLAVPPIDAFDLARACGVVTKPWRKARGQCDGDVIHYPWTVRHSRQHGIVAHELGHWLLRYFGRDPNNEEAARYLSGALLLPREAFLRDCRRTDLDLDELERLHPNASGQMIACRMTQVLPATAWVWDAGKLAATYGIPADEDLVRDLVDRVLTMEEPCRDGPVRAWPRFDGVFRRVLVVRKAA